MTSSAIQQYREPRRLHGLPGTIYVLNNTALRDNIFLVGFSRRSGWAKASELNRDKLNTLPGSFECVFELQAQDGGVAIDTIFNEIAMLRIGKRDYDFFEIAKEKLEEVVFRIVEESNQHTRNKHLQYERRREYTEEVLQIEEKSREEQREEQQRQADIEQQMNAPLREGIFKKANLWINKALT